MTSMLEESVENFQSAVSPAIVEPGEKNGFFLENIGAPILTSEETAIARCGYAITFLAGLHSGWIGALLPLVGQAQNIPLQATGLLVSAASAGALTSLVLSNPIIGRLGETRATIFAAGLAGAGYLGLAAFPGLYLLLACAYCLGFGFGLNGITSHIAFPRFFPHKIASSLSKLNVFYGVGALIGPMVALGLVSAHGPYSLIFAFGAAYNLVAIGYLWRLQRQEKSSNQPTLKAEVKKELKNESTGLDIVFRHPLLIALAAINFLYVGLECSLGSWIYTFLQRADGLSATQASSGLTLLWTGLTAGRIFSTRACLRFNPRYITLFAILVLAVSSFILASVHGSWMSALAFVFGIGFGLGPIFPTIIAQNALRFPLAAGVTTTVIIATGYVGGILMPWAAGILVAACATESGLQAEIPMFAAFGVAILMLVLLLATYLPTAKNAADASKKAQAT